MSGSYAREGYLVENYRYFHLRDTAGQERDFHFHDFDKLVIMLEGKVRYLMETEDYGLQARDILLVRHHCIHKALIDRSEPYERIILYLDRGWFGRMLPEAGLLDSFDRADRERRHLLQPDEAQWRELAALFRRFEENAGADAVSGAMRDTLIMQMLIAVARIAPAVRAGSDWAAGAVSQGAVGSAGAVSPGAVRPGAVDGKITDTLSYIAENLTGDLSVDRLAERVWLSRYHFMRQFKTQTGQSVHAYIRQKRLLQAARLIREGASAAEAGQLCGFKDYSSFHRAFCDTFGCTPGKVKGL